MSDHGFSNQHLVLLNRNWAHNCSNFKADQCTMKLRRWTLNSATGQELELSLVDDWRHCCCCSWRKRRDTASIRCEQAVFPQKTVQTFSFHLMLNTCSSRSKSSYFTFDALNLNLIMSLYLTHFFSSIIFLQSLAAQLVRGNLLFTRYMHDKCMNM